MTQKSVSLPKLQPAFARSGEMPKPAKTASVLSIRVSAKERAELERQAAGQNLSTYVRSALFTSDITPKVKTIEYKQAVAQALGRLGKSAHVGTLKGILRACDDGALLMQDDAEEALRRACAQVEDMRRELLQALGLRPK